MSAALTCCSKSKLPLCPASKAGYLLTPDLLKAISRPVKKTLKTSLLALKTGFLKDVNSGSMDSVLEAVFLKVKIGKMGRRGNGIRKLKKI